MSDHDKTKEQLLAELTELRRRVATLEGVDTDRKRAEDALQKARDELERKVKEQTAELTKANEDLAIFRKFAEASGEGFGMGSLDAQIAYVNPALCRLLGEDNPEDLIGGSFLTYYPEEWKQRRKNEVIPAQQREGRWRGEQAVLSRQGKLIPTLHDVFLLRDAQGRPVRRCAVMTDITERKQAEEALRASEERFRGYFEQGLIGMAVLSLDRRWQEVNDRLCEIFGYSREELLTLTWTEMTHPEDVEPSLVLTRRAMAGEIDHFTFDKRFIRKDGSIVYTTIFIRYFRDKGGGIDHVFAMIEDITERKRAEAALAASEERYRAVVEDQTEIICRFKADGTFTFVNDVFCRFFGKTSEELLGKQWHPVVVPEDLPIIEQQLHALSPVNPIVVVENRVYSGRGNVHWMQFVNRGFFDQEGQLTEVQSVGRDITDRKRAEDALKREHRTLKHMLQSSDHERQLIAYEIHDGLAQQLAAAIMQFDTFCHLKETKPKDAVRAFEAGMTMLRQGHFEARRLISGVRPPVLDESGVVEAIAHLVHEESRRKGPKIACHSKVAFDRLVPILENAIYRIVQESLTNACNHSKSENVRISLLQRGNQVRIEIRDWGVGFDPKAVPKNRFGLTGIRERARLLGGKCRIRSKPGEGTSVTVELPVLERDEDG